MSTHFDSNNQIISARAFAKRLGITQTELALLTGVDRQSFYRQSGLRKLNEAVRPLMRILTIAAEMTGSDQRAVLWLNINQFLVGPEKLCLIWLPSANLTEFSPICCRSNQASIHKRICNAQICIILTSSH